MAPIPHVKVKKKQAVPQTVNVSTDNVYDNAERSLTSLLRGQSSTNYATSQSIDELREGETAIGGRMTDMNNALLTFTALMSKASDPTYSTSSVVENPEFLMVVTDLDDRIIIGIRRDGTYVGLPIYEAIDALMEIIYDIDNS